jgi:hypothetical protein
LAGGGSFQFRENAVTHFSGCGDGEGDGDNLAGLVNFSKQAQKTAREQVSFSGTGRGLHEDGLRRVQCALTLGLIWRRGAG